MTRLLVIALTRGVAASAVMTLPARGARIVRRVGDRVYLRLTDPRTTRLWSFAAVLLALLVAIEALYLAVVVIPANPYWSVGLDYRFYRDIGVRFLADGSYYLPHQLSGPYTVALMADNLYPPHALLLFVPFTVLPAALWWLTPMALAGYVLRTLRPAPWAWVVMLLLLAWPGAIGSYLFGNTNIWVVAGIAAGLRWGWPAVLLTMKPVFAPFALIGIRRRSWWAATAGVALGSLAMLPLWFDYIQAMSGLRIGEGYSLGALPLLLVPIVGWLGRQSRSGAISR